MKKLLLCIYALFLSFMTMAQSTYYVAPTGNDGNPGTLAQPFKTVNKLSGVLHAGDIAYLRGGTYNSTAGNGAGVHFLIQNLTGTSGSPIKIWAYPGETPVFDCSNITPTAQYPFEMMVSGCSYVHLKGLTIKNLKQIANGSGVSYGFAFVGSPNCTAELLNVYNIGGTGCTIQSSNGVTFLNCDSHNNGDGVSPDTWNFGDGFTCTGGDTSTDIWFEGCRTWMNGDDGWDFFGWQGTKVTIRDCWSFWNSIKPWGISGTQPSDAGMTPTTPYLWAWGASGAANYRTSNESGEGFKLGGCNMSPLTCQTGSTTQVRKYLIGCVSYGNMGTGISYNFTYGSQYSHIMDFENCTIAGNGNDGINGCCGRNAGLKQKMHNIISWNNNKLVSGADLAYDGLCDSMSNNWYQTFYEATSPCGKLTSKTVNSSDFVNLYDSLLVTARQADGSLPDISFLHLASGSDLIDAGVNRGFVNYSGSAPDLGAFEYSSGAPVLPTASAGPDRSITLPTSSVTITGTGTGSSITYQWSKVSGPNTPTLSGSTTATVTISGLIQGTYSYEFKVTDGSSNIARDTVNIVVSNTGQVITPALFRQASVWNGKIIINFTASAGQIFSLERQNKDGVFVQLSSVLQSGATSYWLIDGEPLTGNNRYRVRTDKDIYSAEFVKKK